MTTKNFQVDFLSFLNIGATLLGEKQFFISRAFPLFYVLSDQILLPFQVEQAGENIMFSLPVM